MHPHQVVDGERTADQVEGACGELRGRAAALSDACGGTAAAGRTRAAAQPTPPPPPFGQTVWRGRRLHQRSLQQWVRRLKL